MLRLLAIAGMVCGIAGLGINLGVILPQRSAASGWGEALVYYWSFFTHLTNLWLILTWLGWLARLPLLAPLSRPVPRTSAATFIVLVALFYHFMLAPYLAMEGVLQIANILLHYATPALFLMWWAALPDHGRLRIRDIPAMLAPGVIYVACVLLRGAITNDYPYEILDAGKAGLAGVGIGVLVLLAAVSIFAVALTALDRFVLPRRG